MCLVYVFQADSCVFAIQILTKTVLGVFAVMQSMATPQVLTCGDKHSISYFLVKILQNACTQIISKPRRTVTLLVKFTLNLFDRSHDSQSKAKIHKPDKQNSTKQHVATQIVKKQRATKHNRREIGT